MSFWGGNHFGWAPRKSVAARKSEAERKVKEAARNGKPMAPVVVAGRKIATTFWGKAWCDNLERYRDFAHRLERGRSYVRSGSVIDLKIEAGRIVALVSGSSVYKISIEIDEVARDAWQSIQRDCTGAIGSRLDLLSGKLSPAVMTRLCAERVGLFPTPGAIRFTCSCPDYALMCKHVAAVMYGVGSRLDHTPELLFSLRKVSVDELLASAVSSLPVAPPTSRVLAADGLAALFGIELADSPALPSRRATAIAKGPSVRRAKPVPKQKAATAARKSKKKQVGARRTKRATR